MMSIKGITEFEALLQDLRVAKIELNKLEQYYANEKKFWLDEISKTENALKINDDLMFIPTIF